MGGGSGCRGFGGWSVGCERGFLDLTGVKGAEVMEVIGDFASVS